MTARSLRAVVIAATLSALLLWASAPPIGAAALAWVALVPAAAVALRAPSRRHARLALPLAYALYLELLLIPALPFGLTEDQWGETPIPLLVGGSPVLIVALAAVPLFALALWSVRFPLVWPTRESLERLSAPAFVLATTGVATISWVALDLVRAKLDPGGLWGPLYVSQAGAPAARLAALGGPWLVTAALVSVNFALAGMIARRRAAAPVAVAVLGLVGILFALAPAGRESDPAGREALTVAAVQPGYDTADFELPVLRHFHDGTYDLAALDMIRDLGPLTRQAAARGARLVVWPEAALWVDPRRNPRVRAALAALAAATRSAIVVAYFMPGAAEGATVVVDGTGGSPGARAGGADFSRAQAKQRPMWFWGERGGNRRPPLPVESGAGSVGTTLGVDNQDPRSARLLAAEGAGVVSSSTHDWRELAPTQAALSRLHAAATATPLVRADWRYGSAIFDGAGRRVSDAGGEQRRAVLVATVVPGSGSSSYVGIGDSVGWAALGCTLALGFAGLAVGAGSWVRRSRDARARGASPPRRRPVPSSPS